jgi:hypothetical protein
MAKLTWGAAGTRVYEAGVDRGAVYIDGVGYAWSGLTGVEEKASGGEPKPYYVDGFKYLNLAAAEEFEATIKAVSAPKEFSVCEGNVAVRPGLYATGQRKKPFGFSYRTLVGNEIVGLALGYKLHLVYAALAGPSSRSNQSIGDSAEPMELSWDVTTCPPNASGIKPTAHFVVDTRLADPVDVTALEDILYGTSITTPTMPTVAALLALFA